MRYLFDIGHPAEIHTFRFVIQNLREKGHDVLVTARDKEMTLYLLDHFQIPYVSTGKNMRSKAGKIWAFIRNDFRIFRAALKFKPDLIINFFSPFAAHVGKLLRKPVIGFHDTEHADLTIRLSLPFTDTIVVPECYTRDYPGKTVVRFPGNFELAYLHPHYFTPDPSIVELLGISEKEKVVLLRFVSHAPMHDSGHKGFTDEEKIRITEKFSEHAKVFISSEVPLPEELKKYELSIPHERIHDVIHYASLLFGESATMASEAAVLGTPAVFVDEKRIGYTNEEEKKYGLIYNYLKTREERELSIQKGLELAAMEPKSEWNKKRRNLLNDSIDVTKFILWFIGSYPESLNTINKNSGYLIKFK